jgi:hypothetical protein
VLTLAGIESYRNQWQRQVSAAEISDSDQRRGQHQEQLRIEAREEASTTQVPPFALFESVASEL